MLRRIIHIDAERCNGCGLCAAACHEGAIAMVEGKAVLTREDYCDGLGDCLPACPTGAITFVEREAPAYNAAAVAAAKAHRGGGCPGSAARAISHPAPQEEIGQFQDEGALPSQLRQWPVQLKLAPVNAPWFQDAHLLVAADCAAFAHGDFHRRFLRGKVVLVGCPKLDGVDYSEKLSAILAANTIRSVTVVRMEVPCCGGLERAVALAVERSGRTDLKPQVTVLSIDGRELGNGQA